jgi:hypothetical protein
MEELRNDWKRVAMMSLLDKIESGYGVGDDCPRSPRKR